MKRKLTAPKQPETLGRLIAAFRVFAGEREAKNESEKRINSALQAEKLDSAIAKRMIGRFDSISKNTLQRFLGSAAEPDFVAPESSTAPLIATAVRLGQGRVTTPILPGTLANVGTTAAGPLGNLPTSVSPDANPFPVYTIRYQGLWCEQEIDWDQGSFDDEPYLVTSCVHITADGTNVVRTERHPAAQANNWYEDVDSGEERIGPVAAAWQGYSDPVSITVVMMEHDQGDPDHYREEIDYVVKALIAVASKIYPPTAILLAFSSTITDAINWFIDTSDDVVSTETVVLSQPTLETYSGILADPYIGNKRQVSQLPGGLFTVQNLPYSTHLAEHFITQHKGSGANYVVGFYVDREPPLDRLANVVIV